MHLRSNLVTISLQDGKNISRESLGNPSPVPRPSTKSLEICRQNLSFGITTAVVVTLELQLYIS